MGGHQPLTDAVAAVRDQRRLFLTLFLVLAGATLLSAEPVPTASPTNAPKTMRYGHRRRPLRNARPVQSAPTENTTPSPSSGEKKSDAAPAVPASAVKTQLDSFTRKVEVRHVDNPEWKGAKAKMTFQPSDSIRTGSRSVAKLKLQDGSRMLLMQNSQAEFENLSTLEKTIRLVRGKVRAIVSKLRGGNNFKIKTPIGVASVRGTDFEVEVNEDGSEMNVEVHEGSVGVARLGDLAGEVVVNAGESLKVGLEGALGDPLKTGAVPMEKQDVRAEVQIASVKESMLAMAADEARNADYQVGKSLTDVNGQRVRVEEYITRPAADQFKLVVLNERPNRFDTFTYTGRFNKDLPEDLSVALREIGGKLGSSPEYFLEEYETEMSNTVDTISDHAEDGHLVRIDFDGTTYTLTDANGYSREVDAATLLNNGFYRIYNPLKDNFSVVSAENKDEAVKIGVLDSATGQYRDLAADDSYWKARFDTYSSFVNTTAKTAWSLKSTAGSVLAVDLDADFTNGPTVTLSEFPSGTANLYNRLSLYYSDGSLTTYNNYVIDDNGQVAQASVFDGIASSAAYQNELNNWNFEIRATATEMGDRCIDLVIDPRIGTLSGLIQ